MRGQVLAATLAILFLIVGIVAGYYIGKGSTRTVTVTSPVTLTASKTLTETSTIEKTATTTLVKKETRTLTRVVLVDALGRKVVLEKPAARVVSLAPSITEDVCSLGLCDRLVGVDDFSKTVKGLPKNVVTVGGYWQPSTEKVVALKPDLVLACSGVPSQERMAKQLEGMGVKVFFLRCSRAKSLDDIYWDLSAIASLLGKPEAADKVIKEMQQRVAELEKALANTTRPSVALVVYLEKNGAWVAGGGTFQDTLITLAGGSNAFHSLYGWQVVGFEDMLAKNPDYVIVAGMSPSDYNKTLEFFKTTPLKELKAYREGHICVLYGKATDRINRPSPGIVDAAYLLASILHPGKVEPPSSLADSYKCTESQG
ncbi:ABC transporter substrate-binding protein [Pyrofollis japonicus]|uniref:ABC transporter substrate-binding protein n=1 Tax=Pyrofollis japonicus TaxID=3060460 RepID=UPI00295BC7E3|nr:ABC transporter substrate-binding protein [Pyrofollis japonicus]BEP17339.1 ABC transporter substrate-binding protein [Pyrofollis japonicus]